MRYNDHNKRMNKRMNEQINEWINAEMRKWRKSGEKSRLCMGKRRWIQQWINKLNHKMKYMTWRRNEGKSNKISCTKRFLNDYFLLLKLISYPVNQWIYISPSLNHDLAKKANSSNTTLLYSTKVIQSLQVLVLGSSDYLSKRSKYMTHFLNISSRNMSYPRHTFL